MGLEALAVSVGPFLSGSGKHMPVKAPAVGEDQRAGDQLVRSRVILPGRAANLQSASFQERLPILENTTHQRAR